jgi:Cu-Zn family superoxide dismutase
MRPHRFWRTFAISASLLAGLALVPAASAVADDSRRDARAVVRDVNGTFLGVVSLQPSGGKLTVSGRLSGLAPGFHGFHVHAVGRCDPRAVDPATGQVVPFFTAGGHLNPGGVTHGHHVGDLPVLYVTADGTARSIVDNDALTFAAIFDADGAAVIVHALPDNLAHIPTRYTATGATTGGPDTATNATGDAGGRVACGVITR